MWSLYVWTHKRTYTGYREQMYLLSVNLMYKNLVFAFNELHNIRVHSSLSCAWGRHLGGCWFRRGTWCTNFQISLDHWYSGTRTLDSGLLILILIKILNKITCLNLLFNSKKCLNYVKLIFQQ